MARAQQAALIDANGAPWRSRSRRTKVVIAPQNNSGSGQSTMYEAGRRIFGWNAPTSSPNTEIESLVSIRDKCRKAVRNEVWASAALEVLVSNIIGVGIKPLSQAPDAALRSEIQALWMEWTDQSSSNGTNEWYGQQAQIMRCVLEAGECFVRLRPRRPEDGLPVPLQIEVLEPELCNHLYNGKNPVTGNNVRAGVEFSPIGKKVAYYFYESRPGDLTDWDPSRLKRLTSDQVLHIYVERRPGLVRGIPHLTQALIRMRELNKFEDATVLRHQLGTMLTAFLMHGAEADTAGVAPLLGQDIHHESGDRGILTLQPGLFQDLAAGEEVKWNDPPDPISGYSDFVRQQLMGICAALRIPYEVMTGDMSRVNDRTVRVSLNMFYRYIRGIQQLIAYQLCYPIWAAWLDQATLSGALVLPGYNTKPGPWQKAKWIGERWQYLQPVQDVEATQNAIRAGLISRSDAVSEYGEDAEVIDEQQAADNERADALGLSYDSDGRKAKSASNQAAPPADGADPTQDQPPPGEPPA